MSGFETLPILLLVKFHHFKVNNGGLAYYYFSIHLLLLSIGELQYEGIKTSTKRILLTRPVNLFYEKYVFNYYLDILKHL